MRAHVYLNNGDGNFFGYKPEHLESLHRGAVLTMPEYPDPIQALELVFQVCNGADPQSEVLWYMHGNRSLSVGDVVALEIDGCLEAWSCDSMGWSRIEFPTQVPA